MKLIVDSEITIIEPSKDVIDYCKRELVIPNPEYAKKLRMGFWTKNTPEIIQLYKTDGKNIIVPYGCFNRLLADPEFAYITLPNHTPQQINYNRVDLYPYQQTAVDEMIKNVNGILVAPAGSGKTQMALAMVSQLHRKTLWITHTKDLLQQSYERAAKYFDKNQLGTITEGKINIGSGITFATVQTLVNCDLTSLKYVWDCIIVDECHRVSVSGNSVTMFSKVLNNLYAECKYGLTATPFRSDGMIKATFALLGNINYVVKQTAVGDKIVPVQIKTVETQFIPRNYQKYDGTIDFNKLIASLVDSDERNNLIVKEIEKYQDFSILILSSRVGHLTTLYNKLPLELQEKAGLICGTMTSKTEKELREKYIEQMRIGNKKYLFATYNLAKEGLDIPRLGVVLLTTPQKDYSVITQSIGRVARKFDNKSFGIAVDFVDSEPYCYKAYKKRQAIYKKNGCVICSG